MTDVEPINEDVCPESVPAVRETVPKKRKRRSGWGVKDEDRLGLAAFNGFSGPMSSLGLPSLPALMMNAPLPLHMITQQLGLSDDVVRQTRELDVSNLPPNIDAASLSDFLSAALIAVKGNSIAGSPVLRSSFAVEGNYATIELRTMEEANNCMMLNGVDCYGHRLQISRTKTYPTCLWNLEVARQITLPNTSQIVSGMLTGVPLNVSAPCEVLGSAFNEGISRMGTVVVSYPNTVVKTLPNVLMLRNLPPPDVLPEGKILELLTTLGPLKFANYFAYPSLVAMRKILSTYIGRKSRYDIDGRILPKYVKAGEDPSKYKTLADAAMDEILLLQAEEGVCEFEFHYPRDRYGMEEMVKLGDLKVAGREPALLRNGDAALANDELLMLVALHVVRKRIMEKLPATMTPLIVPTRILYMRAIASIEEMASNLLYREIHEDIRIQCRATAKVLDLMLFRGDEAEKEWPEAYEGGAPLMELRATEIPGLLGPLVGEAKMPVSETLDEDGLIGWCIVECASVEDACRTRKELQGRKFGTRKVELHFLDERVWLKRRFERVYMSPNRSKEGSSLYDPSLLVNLPKLLRDLEERDRREKDINRAAATAAANAMFNPNAPGMPGALTSMIEDRAKIDFDADVNKDEEEMDMED